MSTVIETPTQKRLSKEQIDAWRPVTSAIAADQLGGRAHVDARSGRSGRSVGRSSSAMRSLPGASRRITVRCIMQSLWPRQEMSSSLPPADGVMQHHRRAFVDRSAQEGHCRGGGGWRDPRCCDSGAMAGFSGLHPLDHFARALDDGARHGRWTGHFRRCASRAARPRSR